MLRTDDVSASSSARHAADVTRVIAMTDAMSPNLSTLQESHLLDAQQQAVAALPWSWLRQVHSDRVVLVDRPGAHAGATADAVVCTATDAVCAVQVADCVPVALVTPEGPFGLAHAGWRGAHLGVLESTLRALLSVAPGAEVTAIVGPSICGRCYEFGPSDLAVLARRFGSAVVTTTAEGQPGLDMAAVVAAELDRLGVPADLSAVECTAHADNQRRYWSHRARADRSRQAMYAAMLSVPAFAGSATAVAAS